MLQGGYNVFRTTNNKKRRNINKSKNIKYLNTQKYITKVYN